MCGIGGCVAELGAAGYERQLAAMAAALSHRGPDGRSVSLAGRVGLVHTRLAILDPTPAGDQPARSEDGHWTLVYNGELFNHRRLRTEIGGPAPRSTGDTATLLQALQRWDVEALPRLDGQFAFAAIDAERQRLILARDRFGIKPLYWASAGANVWFASTVTALTAAGVKPQARRDAWANALAGRRYSGTATLLDGVQRLPPGTMLTCDLKTGQTDVTRWFEAASVVSPERSARLGRLSRKQLTDHVDDALRTAVEDQLQSDVPVGALCSGGVDSSLICAVATRAVGRLPAYGARLRDGTGLDEGPAAIRAAEAARVDLDLTEVTASDWRAGFVAATVHYGWPLPNASSVTVATMAARARQDGVKVLLTGEGADELFAGYEDLHGRLLRPALAWWTRPLRVLEPVAVPGTRRRDALTDRLTAWTARTSGQPGWSTLTDHEDAAAERRAAQAAYRHHRGPGAALEGELLGGLQYTLGHLLTRIDANVMQHGVEARVPFLAPGLVGLAANLPVATRVGPWTKGVLRDVARRYLPVAVAHRPKIYGMDYGAGRWISEAADPGFLHDGAIRSVLGVSAESLRSAEATATEIGKVRLWSTEIWARSVLGRQSSASIESDLWPSGP